MLLPLIKIKEVADRFQAHWTDAEAILGQPVVLQGGFGLADFQGLIADFDAGTTDYVVQENKREGSLTNVARLGRELRPRVVQFNRAVRALLPGSQVAGVLEVAPDAGMARAKQAEVFERVARLWEIVNLNSPAYPGFTPPLVPLRSRLNPSPGPWNAQQARMPSARSMILRPMGTSIGEVGGW